MRFFERAGMKRRSPRQTHPFPDPARDRNTARATPDAFAN
jgi:hypothetical protein